MFYIFCRTNQNDLLFTYLYKLPHLYLTYYNHTLLVGSNGNRKKKQREKKR